MTPDEARTYFSALTYEKVRDMERRHCVKPGTYFRWRVPAMPIGNPCE
jgi:hypothetical protein